MDHFSIERRCRLSTPAMGWYLLDTINTGLCANGINTHKQYQWVPVCACATLGIVSWPNPTLSREKKSGDCWAISWLWRVSCIDFERTLIAWLHDICPISLACPNQDCWLSTSEKLLNTNQTLFLVWEWGLDMEWERKIEKRVWEIGWGGSVNCTQNAGALPIDSWLHAYAHLLEKPQPASIAQGDRK